MESNPDSAALAQQVQALAATVEELSRQNQELKLQLQQEENRSKGNRDDEGDSHRRSDHQRPATYNVIIGRPALNKWKSSTSTYCLKIKFPTENGVREVKGDQVLAWECYQAVVAAKENHTRMIEEKEKEKIKALETVELSDEEPNKITRIGMTLSPEMRTKLIQFLKENLDVFAWSHDDMPGISPEVIQHRLNVDPKRKPVKQRRRVFALERDQVVTDEVNKLLTVGFIREVYYPDWLANVVLVKKANGKWRMCVNFTDLNKACPKDSFPLPRIDQWVDSTAGHKLLTFMDAFS
ncbi:uncharacterized protein LOC112006266 [Quercus suber]|uniref:uncharacterized protein LOC112006266 n=1 Tax=Quercus suber TaxID=58331 RepID=UPI0032DF8241